MKSLNNKNRNMLKKDMADVLSDRIKTLSNEMQDILLDDLVTAFESRLEVLDRAQLNMHCLVDVAVKVEQ